MQISISPKTHIRLVTLYLLLCLAWPSFAAPLLPPLTRPTLEVPTQTTDLWDGEESYFHQRVVPNIQPSAPSQTQVTLLYGHPVTIIGDDPTQSLAYVTTSFAGGPIRTVPAMSALPRGWAVQPASHAISHAATIAISTVFACALVLVTITLTWVKAKTLAEIRAERLTFTPLPESAQRIHPKSKFAKRLRQRIKKRLVAHDVSNEQDLGVTLDQTAASTSFDQGARDQTVHEAIAPTALHLGMPSLSASHPSVPMPSLQAASAEESRLNTFVLSPDPPMIAELEWLDLAPPSYVLPSQPPMTGNSKLIPTFEDIEDTYDSQLLDGHIATDDKTLLAQLLDAESAPDHACYHQQPSAPVLEDLDIGPVQIAPVETWHSNYLAQNLPSAPADFQRSFEPSAPAMTGSL